MAVAVLLMRALRYPALFLAGVRRLVHSRGPYGVWQAARALQAHCRESRFGVVGILINAVCLIASVAFQSSFLTIILRCPVWLELPLHSGSVQPGARPPVATRALVAFTCSPMDRRRRSFGHPHHDIAHAVAVPLAFAGFPARARAAGRPGLVGRTGQHTPMGRDIPGRRVRRRSQDRKRRTGHRPARRSGFERYGLEAPPEPVVRFTISGPRCNLIRSGDTPRKTDLPARSGGKLAQTNPVANLTQPDRLRAMSVQPTRAESAPHSPAASFESSINAAAQCAGISNPTSTTCGSSELLGNAAGMSSEEAAIGPESTFSMKKPSRTERLRSEIRSDCLHYSTFCASPPQERKKIAINTMAIRPAAAAMIAK